MLLTQLSLEQKSFRKSPEWEKDGEEVTLGGNIVPCPVLLRPEMCSRQVRTGVWQEPRRRGQMQSLARMSLRHEPEVLREIFRAETMKTAIQQVAEFEIHAFWHRDPLQWSFLYKYWVSFYITGIYVAYKRELFPLSYQFIVLLSLSKE